MKSLYQAKVLAHSRSEQTGSEILTFQLRYPRFVHSQFLTHRVFSRNSSSSRAVPVAKTIEEVREQTAMPIFWGRNQPGMQPGEEVENVDEAMGWWLAAADMAAAFAEEGMDLGLHKQIVNRILEPFTWMDTVVTSTEWENWYNLRLHPQNDEQREKHPAQEEIRHLAYVMHEAQKASTPRILKPGEAHLPYILERERTAFDLTTLCKLSAARCARVSYKNHDGTEPDVDKDFRLAQRLAADKHWSPFEHQAVAYSSSSTRYAANFSPGWIQHRKVLEYGESLDDVLFL